MCHRPPAGSSRRFTWRKAARCRLAISSPRCDRMLRSRLLVVPRRARVAGPAVLRAAVMPDRPARRAARAPGRRPAARSAAAVVLGRLAVRRAAVLVADRLAVLVRKVVRPRMAAVPRAVALALAVERRPA